MLGRITDLQSRQSECVELFFEMRRSNARDSLAAPFVSSADSPPTGGALGTILLVGKATAGNWKIEDFEPDRDCPCSKRVEERRNAARSFLRAMHDRPKSAFWRFWRGLGAIGSPVIWTNLVKIGVKSGNPQGCHLEMQAELAVKTLKAEITEYDPSLVVLATSDYAKDQIVYRVWPQKTWTISSFDGTCWIRGKGRKPSVLWTDHPQGKTPNRLAYWLKTANLLIRNR